MRDDVDATLRQLHLAGEALGEPAARDEDLARCSKVRLTCRAPIAEATQHLPAIPTREVREETRRALALLSVSGAGGSVLGRAEVARTSDEVIVQREDDGHT